jgi:hypothetical protein
MAIPWPRHGSRGHPPPGKAIARQSAQRAAALTSGKCNHLPARQWMADLLFSERLFEQIRLHAEVRDHALQASVVVLERLHLADHGRVCHPAGFCFAKAREGMPPYFARHL